MLAGWGSLPLLPLRCVLEHLSTEDALAATSVCRHWRSALPMYEGHKETLTLSVKQLDKSLFLTRMFRKYTRQLHIYIDCSEAELEHFINYVLPQFFDTQKLNEVIFIGPSYITQSNNAPVVKLKRKITESLLFKHLHCIQSLSFLGCEMSTSKNVENENYEHKHFDYYSRPLSFESVSSPADTVLSRSNVGLMVFSTLQHITVDYDSINTEALETLSHLTLFKCLTLNIAGRRRLALQPIDWQRLHPFYPNGLDVSVNIIALPARKLNDVMEKVLVEGLTLTSLKVMFCRVFYAPLLSHLVTYYKSTLRELVWVDCPYDSKTGNRGVKNCLDVEGDMCEVNPLILICWQCVNLTRLVIHGYWVSQYDLLGFVRLRKTLRCLEVSAVRAAGGRRSARGLRDSTRVLPADVQRAPRRAFVQCVNEQAEFAWRPCARGALHAGLRAGAAPAQRADYALRELRRPPPVVLPVTHRQ